MRLGKKFIKRMEKDLADIKSGKAKTYMTDEVFSRLRERIEKEKHFPHSLFKALRCWKRSLKDKIYYIKCRLFKKYNVVKIKTLPPTWVDRDSVLLHGMFQIFVDFIEKEDPFKTILWDRQYEIDHAEEYSQDPMDKALFIKEDQEVKAQKKELEDIYNWWKVVRPAKIVEIDNLWKYDPSKLDWNENDTEKISNLEVALYKEEEEFMIRLIKIRKNLWT